MALRRQENGDRVSDDLSLIISRQRFHDLFMDRTRPASSMTITPSVAVSRMDSSSRIRASTTQFEFRLPQARPRIGLRDLPHEHQASRIAAPIRLGMAHFDRDAFPMPRRQRGGRIDLLGTQERRAAAEEVRKSPCRGQRLASRIPRDRGAAGSRTGQLRPDGRDSDGELIEQFRGRPGWIEDPETRARRPWIAHPRPRRP